MRVELFCESHLQQLSILQPEGWADLVPSFTFYLQHPFCHPICVMEGEKVIGVGSCVIHQTTAWLCHIIVHAEERNRGLGKQITQHLIAITQRHPSVETLLLLATPLGAPVYRKSGFEVESEYVFYKGGQIPPGTSDVIRCTDAYFNEVLKLDEKISGEVRTALLTLHRHDCWIKLEEGKVDGFYCPSLGDGLILAQTPVTGIALMTIRAQRESKFIMPEQNLTAADFLLKHSYQPFLRGTRMRLGKKIPWHPESLFNRIGGNLG